MQYALPFGIPPLGQGLERGELEELIARHQRKVRKRTLRAWHLGAFAAFVQERKISKFFKKTSLSTKEIISDPSLHDLRRLVRRAGKMFRLFLDAKACLKWVPYSWTITDVAGDGSWAATCEAATPSEALELLAQDYGYSSFEEYCQARDRVASDFVVVLDDGTEPVEIQDEDDEDEDYEGDGSWDEFEEYEDGDFEDET